MKDDDQLAEAKRLSTLAQQYAGKGITEQDTKNAFVEPVLAMFGWPKHDLERVRAEYRPTSKYNPVDYALFDNGKPVMFVEAKPLDVPIDEPRTVGQILSYASIADVQ